MRKITSYNRSKSELKLSYKVRGFNTSNRTLTDFPAVPF